MPRTLHPPAQLPPESTSGFVEIFGSAVVMNRYLRLALLCVSAVAVGLVFLNVHTARRTAAMKPLIIRIDDVGRAQAVHYDALTYRPQGAAPELRYFLIQFITKHFGRMRSTAKDSYAESLLFLDASLAEAAIAEAEKAGGLTSELTGTADEIEIVVRNVTVDDLRQSPFRAAVDFEKVYYAVGNRRERSRETYVAQLRFVVRDQIPNALIPVNPLGLTVTYIRVDQAFR